MNWEEIRPVRRPPVCHLDAERPLVESWGAITLFSAVSGFTMVTLVTTARTARLSFDTLLGVGLSDCGR